MDKLVEVKLASLYSQEISAQYYFFHFLIVLKCCVLTFLQICSFFSITSTITYKTEEGRGGCNQQDVSKFFASKKRNYFLYIYIYVYLTRYYQITFSFYIIIYSLKMQKTIFKSNAFCLGFLERITVNVIILKLIDK